MATKKQQYVKKDQISHILDRPDMYVGSTRSRVMEEYVLGDNYRIEKKNVDISPAILRIFIEPLSNCIDNVARSKKGKKTTEIRVNINKETGETSFWNDGEVIPIEIHEEEKCYNQTLIFGHLLTSSNYDDENDDREDVSGRNGLGIKCTSVFASQFTVEGVDPINKKRFEQTWTNNMKKAGKPIVEKSTLKKGYTKISYIPDFKQFNLEGYTDDILSLYYKYVVDAAMITKVPFYLNDELVPVNSLVDYAKLYSPMTRVSKSSEQKDSSTNQTLYIKTDNCEVVLTQSNEHDTISFANGVYTPLGGTHVDSWSEELFRPLVKKLNKPKRPQINIKDVKQYFRLFVVASVKKPCFDSQSKTKLESPMVKAEVKKTHIATICKWPVMEHLEDIIRAKEMLVLKKVERKNKYIKVDGLDSANFEGGPRSSECILALVEGLSAKTYVTKGIDCGEVFGKSGRDFIGIYALRGKLLNTRNATASSISKNKVITDIIKALGLKTGIDYMLPENYKKLRYGKVLVICDADEDGLHISGLIQNVFHSLYPTLLTRKEAFITAMQTPIVRVYLTKKNSILFYDESEYKKYVQKYSQKYPDKQIDKKYYKGLGTNNDEDIAESFGKKLVEFRMDDKTFENMNKAFHTKYADARKDWLANYDPERRVLKWKGNDTELQDITFTDFINTELIKFSHADCKRSIPSLMDGLKESHRKVLYVAFLRNLKYTGKTLKVAQLAGSVAEKSGYHHGEQNLLATIIGMAQSFIGSNNIPLLYRDGQFGTRIAGGKDAANGRYIFTKLEMLTRLIFRPEDDVLLTQREDDGEKVEPYFYVPIIPMILVNGINCGIGTGWSSNLPCYNPLDIVNALKIWIASDGNVIVKENDMVISSLPQLIPWYRGHTGKIESTDDPTKYISWGRFTKKGSKSIVEELPVNVWTNNYKEQLEQWKEEKEIVNFQNHSTAKEVKFIITESPSGLECNLNTLKLSNTIRTSNMCMFNEKEQLRKYNTVDEIIDNFCRIRLEYYFKRKAHQLGQLEHQIKFLGNKKRFLCEIRDGKIKLFIKNGTIRESRKTEDIISELQERGYDRDIKETPDDEEDSEQKDSGYDYLLRLQFRSITSEKINKLQNDIDSIIKTRDLLRKTTESQLWLNDLDEFEHEYHKWLKIISAEKVKVKKTK